VENKRSRDRKRKIDMNERKDVWRMNAKMLAEWMKETPNSFSVRDSGETYLLDRLVVIDDDMPDGVRNLGSSTWKEIQERRKQYTVPGKHLSNPVVRKHNARKITETFEYSKEQSWALPEQLKGFEIAGRDGKISLTFDERDKQQVVDLLRAMADSLEAQPNLAGYIELPQGSLADPKAQQYLQEKFAEAWEQSKKDDKS
jgi:hypothetical protein